MFELGTMLVHPTYGVCEVVHIGKIDMKNVKDERLFYTLVPLYDAKSKLFIPTDSESLGLRPVMTKESALELVASLSEMEPIAVQNEKEREKIFKEMIRGGNCEDISRIIKTLYLRKKARLAAGKKAVSLDEKYLFIAREQLYGELAVSLGIEKNGVEDYITQKIEHG
ncbi:MAG: CarD family transcriptional regulator [Lachnospiraceae bacterium]|nr:CarD family transcriptional regulator [Lachnospiraceae bacterium]